MYKGPQYTDKLGNPVNLCCYCFITNKKLEEISHTLGYKNVDTTKNQKYKCLKRLQTLFFNINKKVYALRSSIKDIELLESYLQKGSPQRSKSDGIQIGGRTKLVC
ncbi:MAG: hypothetical protein IPN49_10125 [Saprospiraceae bacterium]|nr:hypothetical protein [Saprospiraceae bacterium]